MREAEHAGMESLSVNQARRLHNATAVHLIPQYGTAHVGQVYPNLMGSARIQPALDPQTAVPKSFGHLEMSDCATIGNDFRAESLAVSRVASIRRVDRGLVLETGSLQANGESDIDPIDGMSGKLSRETFVCVIVFRDDEQTAGVAIEAVNDPGPKLATNSRQVRHPVKQGVDEGVIAVTRRRVNHHPSRLVHDDEVGVFVENVERHVPADQLERFGFGYVELDAISLTNAMRCSRDHLAVDSGVPFRKCPLHARAADGCRVGQKAIEPQAVLFLVDDSRQKIFV
jgi:hypothetical protein